MDSEVTLQHNQTTTTIMKLIISILLAGLILVLMNSCSSLKPVKYANREWHISGSFGQIIDKDTTYRMTFGKVLMAVDQPIISCSDSAAKYPGMEKFISDIMYTAGLENDELLFYSPEHGRMFVRLIDERPPLRPSSLTANMPALMLNNENEQPYTCWIYQDDIEPWFRKPEEMYTYTYFDKKKQCILVVDFYDYGDTPIAEIFVYQSRNKMTDRIKLPVCLWTFSKHNLKDYKRDIEFWSYVVNAHRKNAFENYKIGQEQLKKKK